MSDITTAKELGLVGCRRCARVWSADRVQCDRCGAPLSKASRKGLFWVWFWWVLGAIAYMPAMVLPMLETRMLLATSSDTIVVGAWKLASHGSVLIAIVILVASVVVPLAKFAAIAYLAHRVNQPEGLNTGRAHRLYEVVELIGRWSMIDVFVVAILASLVQFSFIATVKPGAAALTFALSVIFTMLSAQSFDPRLIWDNSALPRKILNPK